VPCYYRWSNTFSYLYLSEPAASIDTATSGIDSQPDSLTLDWQYQLPPPPTHFRDPSTSPTPTENRTMATINTLPAVETLPTQETPQKTSQSNVKSALLTLNGTELEDSSRVSPQTNAKTSLPTINDKTIKDDAKNVPQHNIKTSHPVLNGIYEDNETNNELLENRPRLTNVYGSDVFLTNKSDVMSELTNVLTRNKEKSQSFSNLYIPSQMLETKKKSATLSHGQSLINPPISNFKITNYEPRSRDDFEFKKPKSVAKTTGVRRSDSMNVRKSIENVEEIKLQFLEFLREKQILEHGEEIDNIISEIIPKNVSKTEIKTENKPVIVNEVKKPVITDEVKTNMVEKENVIHEVKRSSYSKVSIGENSTVVVNPTVVTSTVNITNYTPVESEDVTDFVENTKVYINEDKLPERDTDKVDQRPSSKTTVVNISGEKMAERDTEKVEMRVSSNRSVFRPPSISMGTWGERPKSKVVIKDEDYTTEYELPEKSSYVSPVMRSPSVEPLVTSQLKKTASPFKKALNYEMFSSLSKKLEKEEESLEDRPKPPVVCAVELKKQFKNEEPRKDVRVDVRTADEPRKSLRIEPEPKPKPDVIKSTYLAQNFTKGRTGLVPVVKGFRVSPTIEEKPDVVNIVIKKQESLPDMGKPKVEPLLRQESLPARIQIPAPPPMGSVALKPVGNRQLNPKIINDDPRGMLLDQIRNFGGREKLRSVQ